MYEIESIDLPPQEGFDLRLTAEWDVDSTPDDSECYDEAQIKEYGESWNYVTYIVSAYKAGIELGSAGLHGNEYGVLPGVDDILDMEYFIKENYYLPDLIAEAIDEAKYTLDRLTA